MKRNHHKCIFSFLSSPPPPSISQITHRCSTHTQLRLMKAVPAPSAQPLPTSFANEKFCEERPFASGAAHCVFGGGGLGRGSDRGCALVCVAGAQMKQPSPGARRPPAVAASLFHPPRPAATICSINQSPGASGTNTHTSTGIHTSTTACTAHATHGPPSFALSLPRSCSPPDARTIFLCGGHMAQ